MKFATLCATACLLLLSAGDAAAAITYVANRAVGGGTLDLSITTDGTLGILSDSNILDWSLTLTDGADVLTLEGPDGSNNSDADVFGDQLSATATDLLFDLDFFGGLSTPSAFVIRILPNGAFVTPFWCVAFTSCGGVQVEAFTTDGAHVQASPHSGLFVIGSVAGGVPEPATWSLLIAGLGLAGASLRQRRPAIDVKADVGVDRFAAATS